MTTIPGLARRSACLLLAQLGDVHRFSNARKLVAFAGLTPPHFESGSTVHRYTRISRMGSSAIRRILYMPCLSAIQQKVIIRSFFQRLVERGKPRKAAVVACMGKLLKIYLTARPDPPTTLHPSPGYPLTSNTASSATRTAPAARHRREHQRVTAAVPAEEHRLRAHHPGAARRHRRRAPRPTPHNPRLRHASPGALRHRCNHPLRPRSVSRTLRSSPAHHAQESTPHTREANPVCLATVER